MGPIFSLITSSGFAAIFLFSGIASAGSSLPELGQSQHEVTAVRLSDGSTVLGWMDTKPGTLYAQGGIPSASRCAFSISSAKDEWSSSWYFESSDFEIAGNPSLAVTPDGTVVALCMVVHEYSRGELWLSTHAAETKAAWTPWRRVFSKSNGIPDQPRILAPSNDSWIVGFTQVESRDLGGQHAMVTRAVVVRSANAGVSWSDPVALSPSEAPVDPADWTSTFIRGDQGVSLELGPEGAVLASYGTYAGDVFFLSSQDQGRSFSAPKLVSSRELLENPRPFQLPKALVPTHTQITLVPGTSRVLISWYEAHGFEGARIAESRDGGSNWLPSRRIGNHSTYLTIEPSRDGKALLAWQEEFFSDAGAMSGTVEHRFAWITPENDSRTTTGLPLLGTESTPISKLSSEYLGAYQALVDLEYFWIDLTSGVPRMQRSSLSSVAAGALDPSKF